MIMYDREGSQVVSHTNLVRPWFLFYLLAPDDGNSRHGAGKPCLSGTRSKVSHMHTQAWFNLLVNRRASQ